MRLEHTSVHFSAMKARRSMRKWWEAVTEQYAEICGENNDGTGDVDIDVEL